MFNARSRVPCSIQIRANSTKSGWGSDSYYAYNVPETEFNTENNCKSPTDCPDSVEGHDTGYPWTAVSMHASKQQQNLIVLAAALALFRELIRPLFVRGWGCL